jgi:hypothetical protein
VFVGVVLDPRVQRQVHPSAAKAASSKEQLTDG